MNERLLDYLLDELDPSERAAFEAAPERVAEAERLRPIVSRLESLAREEWDPPEAPTLALPRAPEPQPAQRRLVLALRPMVAACLAVLLLALGIGAGLLLGNGGSDRGRKLVLEPVEPAGGAAHGTVTIQARDGRAKFTLRGLKPSAGGNFYELWLMNSADDLVSLGSFRVPASGEADVTVPLPADPDSFAALDISAEPGDGNPAHSTRSVLRAPLKTS
jgi:anti-sigma-K factor RskA